MPSLMHARALRARIRRAGTVDAKPDVRLGHPNRFQHVLMKYFPLIAVRVVAQNVLDMIFTIDCL